jgi:hypothetical protein
VHGLESEYSDELNFIYLDVDDPANDEFKSALGYIYQPHLFLLDENGEILQEWVGPVNHDQLVEAFEIAISQ